MQVEPKSVHVVPLGPVAQRYAGPIWTLLVLSPVIAEVLSGSTRISFIFVLVPEIMVWGCGALLCRELVLRWRAGTPSLLMLGLALSIAEEFIIQQTSVAPLPFAGANASFGRIWGVNWIYFIFMLGFESVWVLLVPVRVTELLFPLRRSQSWLNKRSLLAVCAAFLFGSFIAWYSWTQQARPKQLHVPAYHPPLATLASGVAAVLVLGWIAYCLRSLGRSRLTGPRKPVAPWLVGLIAFFMALPWFVLISLVFVPHPMTPVWVPMSAGIAWALVSFEIFWFWSAAPNWSDTHLWAASFGATLACMSFSYVSTAGWSKVDLVGKIILNVLAAGGFVVLGRLVMKRDVKNLKK